MTSSFIGPLDTQETQDDSLEVVGGKGRSLARLANAGFDVPGGFQVTAAAYLAVLERWRVFTPGEMTNRQLLEGIRSLNVADARYWHVLRRIIGAAKGTDMALQTFLERNAPGEGFASGTFLSGFKSKVVDAEMAMRAIAERPRQRLRSCDPAARRGEKASCQMDPGTEVLQRQKTHSVPAAVLDGEDQLSDPRGRDLLHGCRLVATAPVRAGTRSAPG